MAQGTTNLQILLLGQVDKPVSQLQVQVVKSSHVGLDDSQLLRGQRVRIDPKLLAQG